MPSIEIICIRQKSPSRFPGIPFAMLADRDLKSHRSPSLFQKDFDKLKGCIYHLGCPHLKSRKSRGFFEAYQLLSSRCREQESTVFLDFRRVFVPAIRHILHALIQKSPTGSVVFTSDYQFSTNRPKRFKHISIDKFWLLHRRNELRFNSLYVITGNTNGI